MSWEREEPCWVSCAIPFQGLRRLRELCAGPSSYIDVLTPHMLLCIRASLWKADTQCQAMLGCLAMQAICVTWATQAHQHLASCLM